MQPDVQGRPRLWQDGSILADRYTYDNNGNVTAIADQTANGSTVWTTSRSLGYDDLDRLTTASGRWGSARYAYDGLDNLVSSTVGPRSLTHKIDRTTNRLERLSGSPSMDLQVLYDANGNVIQRGTQGFSFDIGNRLISAVGRASYSYDGHGRRVWVYANGAGRMQMYTQDGKLRYGSHPSQGQTRHIYLGGKLIAEVNSLTGTSYVHTDALGSPVARTNAAKLVTTQTQYEPYGGTAAGIVPTGIGFTGHVNDADTGLVYMQQRYYDPVAGRFLSVDPITTDAKRGGHFNRYTYANNNPYKYIDPDGQAPQEKSYIYRVPLEGSGGGGSIGSSGGGRVSNSPSFPSSTSVAGAQTSGGNAGALAGKAPTGVVYNGINGPGPLGANVAGTFRSSTYTEITTTETTTLYRVWGGKAGEVGAYWTRTPPAGPVQSSIDSALNPAWGNTATNVTRIQVPAGIRIYEGVAAPQGGLVGGGNQVLVPKVEPTWIVR